MAGGEQGAALGDLVEADQQDVDDERDEQQHHGVGKGLADALHGLLHGVLTIVGVNDAGGEIEAVLQTRQDGAEGAGQAAGAGVQDQHADDRFQGAAQGVVPLLAHQGVAQQGQESHHVGGLLQHVCGKEIPDGFQNIQNYHYINLFSLLYGGSVKAPRRVGTLPRRPGCRPAFQRP